jgi:hypothetical protein
MSKSASTWSSPIIAAYLLPMGGSAKIHGAAHVIVENQIALGDPPATQEALTRLIGEGLTRHDAVHAVGSVVMAIVFDVTRGKGDPNGKITRELAALTVVSWRAQTD